MKKKINIPDGIAHELELSIPNTDIIYTIYLYFDEDFKTWYIRIVYTNLNTNQTVDTQYCALTVAFIMFQEYKNLLPHCFFCLTETGFNPDTADSFNPQTGTATLYVDTWKDRLNELS